MPNCLVDTRGVRGREDRVVVKHNDSVVEKDLMVEKRIIESLNGLDLKKQIEIILAFLGERGSKIEITRYINFNERIEEIDEDLISYLASIKNTDILLILAKLLRNNRNLYNFIIDVIIKIIDETKFWETTDIIKMASELNDIRVTRVFVEMILGKRKCRINDRGCYLSGRNVLMFIERVPNAPKKELIEKVYGINIFGDDNASILARLLVSEEQKVHNLEKKLELVKKMKGKSISRSKIKVFEESKKYVKKR